MATAKKTTKTADKKVVEKKPAEKKRCGCGCGSKKK